MEETIELLEMILKEIKQWDHEPRPATIEALKTNASAMYQTIFG